MQRFRQADLRPVLITSVFVIGVTYSGLPQALGAHHFWSVQVGLIGMPAGMVIWGVLRLSGQDRWNTVLVLVILLLIAGLAAVIGKALFVASYAEDALAGRVWYLGWIASFAALTSLLLTMFAPRSSSAS